MKRIVTYTLVYLLLAACNAEDAWDMVKTRGSRKEEVRELPAFTRIDVYNGINVVLQKGKANMARLDGWANLLPKVRLTVNEEGVLTMEDKNGFNFLRDLSNMTTVYLMYSDDIGYIFFQGNGKITSGSEPLRLPSLYIVSEDASGSIDLALNTTFVGIGTNHRNIADISIRGQIDGTLGITNWGNAPMHFDCNPIPYVEIVHKGTGDIYVNVGEKLNAALYSLGDIYYRGTPAVIVERKGKGSLIAVKE